MAQIGNKMMGHTRTWKLKDPDMNIKMVIKPRVCPLRLSVAV